MGFYLVNWKSLSRPKEFKGWGLKDLWLFGKDLASKYLWVFINRDNLWRSILVDKYISLESLMDYMHRRNKRIHDVSNK
jgi:hypothetical protein